MVLCNISVNLYFCTYSRSRAVLKCLAMSINMYLEHALRVFPKKSLIQLWSECPQRWRAQVDGPMPLRLWSLRLGHAIFHHCLLSWRSCGQYFVIQNENNLAGSVGDVYLWSLRQGGTVDERCRLLNASRRYNIVLQSSLGRHRCSLKFFCRLQFCERCA